MERSEKNRVTQRRLHEAALTAFATHGYDGVSMQDIAALAGLTKGALYYRYATKEALFDAVLAARVDARAAHVAAFLGPVADAPPSAIRAQEAATHLVAALTGDETWDRLLIHALARAARDPDFEPRLARLLDVIRQEIVRVLEARAYDLDSPSPLPVEHLAAIIDALVAGLGSGRLAGGADHSPPELTASAVSLLLSGVAIAGRVARASA